MGVLPGCNMTSSLNSYANTPNVIVVIAEDAAITTITLGVLTYEPIGSIGIPLAC